MPQSSQDVPPGRRESVVVALLWDLVSRENVATESDSGTERCRFGTFNVAVEG